MVTYRILLDSVTKNGNPDTNMTSAANVSYLFTAINSAGIPTYSGLTGSGLPLVHLPLMHGNEGPNMERAFVMSLGVRGEL